MPPRDPNDDDHDTLGDEGDEVQPDDPALIGEPADEDTVIITATQSQN